MMRILLAGLLVWWMVSGVQVVFGDAAESFEFSEEQKSNRFFKDFERFVGYDKGKVPFRDGVLLIGSSSMAGWRDFKEDLAPMESAKRGFGGSIMSEVLLFEDFFLRYEAGIVIIYEGDNDIWRGVEPEEFVSQCKKFAEALLKRREDTKVYFLSIKPSISRWSKWPVYEKANALLKEYTGTDDRLYYIDIATPMLGEDGKPLPDIFVKDNLHLNRAGYVIWRDAIRKALNLEPLKGE